MAEMDQKTDDCDCQAVALEAMSQKEYYDLCNQLPRKAIVPLCEMMKPGGIIFTGDSIHLYPFGCNLVPFDDEALNTELKILKQDAALANAKVTLDLAASSATSNCNKKLLTKTIQQCGFCKGQGIYKCQSCMSVSYCSRKHQLEHWKTHRPFCILYDVVNSSEYGYHVVAKTNIKKGETIIIEEPCVVSPFSTDEHFGLINFEPVSNENKNIQVGNYTVEEFETNVCQFPVVCTGCSVYLSPEIAYNSCVCGWPVCGKRCSEENMIEYEECRKMAVLSPRIIGIVRALLMKNRNPQKWDMLFNEICKKIWMEKIQADMDSRMNAEYLLFVLRSIFRFSCLQYSEINSVLAVIELRGMYGCQFEQEGNRCRRIVCVYNVGSLIRHRCIGNVLTIQTTSGALHVIAAKSIKKGEPLFRNHNLQGDMLHVLHRQHFAMSMTNKFCDCSLCVDLSAGENCLSAIVCLKCKRRGFESFMLVETPTTADSTWKCHRCNLKKSSQQVQNLLHDISKELEFFAPTLNYEGILRSCITKYKGVLLHPEHSIILAAEFDLIFYMMDDDRIMSLDQREASYLVQLLNTRISNLSKFVPDAHSSVVSMKMRLATVMVLQAYRGHLDSEEMRKVFDDLQFIHDDIAQSFVENTKANALQEYLLVCLRKLRKLMVELGELFQERRHIKQLLNLRQSLRNAGNLAIWSKKPKTEVLEETD